MIAPPQVRGPSAGQPIPMTFFLGPQQTPGLIQLPQQQPPANVIPTMNPQPLVCTNPPVAVQQQPTFQQIPQGVAVTRLPNGGCPILPNSNIAAAGSVNPIPAPSPTVAMATASTPPVAVSTGCNGSPGPALQPAKPIPPPQSATRADPESVLRQLNQEINNLQNMTTPLSDQQKTRLQKLVDARDKVQRSIELNRTKAAAGIAGSVSNPSAVIRPAIASPQNAALRPRPPGPPTNILPAVRTEVVNLLMKHRLLPVNQTGGESVLVEFRLNSQRYQLYLTRTQKADLESLLYTLPSNQKKADVLLVYQTEQMRFFATHPRPAPPVAAQLRLVRPPGNQIAQAAPQPGIAQSTPHVQPPPQPRLPLPMCVLAPAPSLMPNSAANPADPGSKCPPVKVSVFGSSMPIVRATPPAPPQSVAPAVSRTAPQKTPNPLSQPSAQQLRRHNAVRGLFHSDQMASNAQPPVLSIDNADDGSTKPLPTLEELINLLAPYHVQQDMDNSPAALQKVDDILDKAFSQLNTRKRQTVDAINSILYVEKWQLMERPSVDRIPLTRLLRDGERERLEAERTAFDKITTLMAEAAQPPSAKIIRQLLNDAAPDFIPLEFDKNGNSRPAILQLEEEEGKLEERMELENPRGIPPDPAWPTWEMGSTTIGVDDDDGGDIDFRPPSPDVDIANAVVEEDEVPDISLNKFGERSTIPPLNGLPMDFLSPSTSRTEMPRIHQRQSTEEDGSCQRLRHSEDPTVDEAIRSIIDL
ncbi:unnamed protein product [Hymenolepis diminuta]|uniref:Uncharacterized protein n=1 Tax=Hymenolepis diminuta TaxID=6216 RepID=A0A564YIP1_HYMDI|nr:unnamed protein product [Hymenolepis diminuta]